MSLVFTPEGTPASPVEGEVYYDSTADKLKVRDSSAFREVVTQDATFNGTIGDSITLSQGTWTPTFTDSSGSDLVTTYSTRHATYTRIGNLIFFNVEINLSSYSNSSSSHLYLSGLPSFGVSFSSTNVENNGYPGGIVSFYSGLSSSYGSSYSIHWILQNSGRINFYYADGTSTSNFQQKWLTSSTRFIFEGKYYLAEIT